VAAAPAVAAAAPPPPAAAKSAPAGAPAATAAASEAPASTVEALVTDPSLEPPLQVEFAEEDTDKHMVRAVKTKGNMDIGQELEKLRALTNEGGDKPAAPAVIRDREVDRLFQDLMVSDKEARQEVKRKAAVDVPARLLKGLSDLRIHLAFQHGGQEELVKDAVTVKLVGTKRLERLTLRLDLELKSKG
jgi:hypothetical protein